MRRVLVFLTGSLGDTLIAIPALRRIRAQLKDGDRISVLYDVKADARARLDSVLEEQGLVDEFIAYQLRPHVRGMREVVRVWRVIRRGKFDAVVYLLSSERRHLAVMRDKFFFVLSGIRRLDGFFAFSAAEVYPRDENGRLVQVASEAQFRLRRVDGRPATAEELERAAQITIPNAASARVANFLHSAPGAGREDEGLIALAPGAKQPSCRWPLDRFREIGARILSRGLGQVVIVGSAAERPMAAELLAAWGGGMDATGELSAVESGALLARCRLLVGNDTGTTHLAAAVGTPVVAVFSARDHPGRWHPIGRRHEIIRESPPCEGCHALVCPVEGHPCIAEIMVDEVWSAVEQVLGQPDRSSNDRDQVSGSSRRDP